MSILFADDFGGYGLNSAFMLNGLWGTASFNITNDIDPNSPAGTKALYLNANFSRGRRPFAKGSIATMGCAGRVWFPNLPGFAIVLFAAMDGANNVLLNTTITATGVLEIHYGYGGGVLATSGAPVITANSYHHVESKFTHGGAGAGSASVRVDGVEVINVTGLTTAAATCEQFFFNNVNPNGDSGAPVYLKDLVVWDTSGTKNNDFLGTVSVIGMSTDADVSLNWTPSTGTTGFDLLADSPPVDATRYISAAYPAPAPSLFTLTDLPNNVTSVRGLISQARARKIDGGDGNLQAALVSGASTVLGADRPITTAFTYYEDVFEIDPATGNSWTVSAANAAKFQINRTL